MELANDVNEHMPDYVVRRLTAALNHRGRAGERQPDPRCSACPTRRTSATCGSRRPSRSPSASSRWAPTCGRWSPTSTRPRDPRISLVELTPEEVVEADAVVLLTDHDPLDLELVVAEARYVLDTRFRLSGPNVERL